jgi:DNA primase large subunit
MAQMRVKDQDLVIEQIKSKVNEQGLEALKNRKDVQRITNQLDARISEVKTLQAQREELTKKITKLKNSMGEVVSEFQKEFTNKDDSYNWSSYFRGISFDANNYSEGIQTYSLKWNMPREESKSLETKVRLQTMGTDFDVYKLIEDLTAEFSS